MEAETFLVVQLFTGTVSKDGGILTSYAQMMDVECMNASAY